MKNILLAGLFMASFGSVAAEQQLNPNYQQQGFSGPSVAMNTVKSVLDAGMFSDDRPVTLTGHILTSQGGELYTFTDGTGNITVEIDNENWYGIQVTPKTKITINGEIDKEFGYTRIDVDSVMLAR
ncbi:NirD/YgiW/YdeI family stress tolerance protein [Photobacterium damselae]|uniref:NirD/YgiW/YdeI family stress tolerance protein n=1 Tax=Photobacterium damselae TaxID=38293 RepID=UPI0040677A35